MQLVTQTLLPAGMLAMIFEYVPGALRRLTLAVTEMVVAIGRGCGPAEGGYGCARPTIAGATMMISVALSALKWKGMGIPSSTTTPLLVYGQC
jgi:hypothetical protein